MLTERVSTATRYLWRSVTACARNVLTLRERYRAMMDAREARGITLLREWLSPMQRAQFDATKYFEVVGCDTGRRYRIHYGTVTNVHQIDASGQLQDGTKFEGVAGLRQILNERSDQFVYTLTEKLLTFALGRGADWYDAPAIRDAVRAAQKDDYRFSTLVTAIVSSRPFQMRMSQPLEPEANRLDLKGN